MAPIHNMKDANFTSFPGVDIAFIKSVAEISREKTVVAADPPVCLRWKRAILEAIGKGDPPARPWRIKWHGQKYISGYLFRSNPNGIRKFHGRQVYYDASELPSSTVVLLSATRWERDLIDYYERGFRCFATLPIRDLNTGWRRTIVSDKNGFVFLQNYKVMYSALRDFMRNNLAEFADRSDASYALNSYVDLTSPRYTDYFKFSIVRNPWDRITSAYRDKLCRGPEHENYRNYRESIGAIMECGPDIGFETFARYIAQIPNSHANQHWLSQYANLYRKGDLLIDYVGRYEDLESSLGQISKKTGFQWCPGHVHRTAPDGLSYRDYYDSKEVVELVAKHYGDDVDAFGYSF